MDPRAGLTILIPCILVVAMGEHEMAYSCLASVICPIISGDFSFQEHY